MINYPYHILGSLVLLPRNPYPKQYHFYILVMYLESQNNQK